MLQCYYMDVNCGCSYEQSQVLYRALPSERRDRIERLRDPAMARSRILSGSLMQYGIERVTGIPASKQYYIYGMRGKPALLRRPEIQFNLSHAGRYAVFVISDTPVGVDVERLRKNRLAIARRFFCEPEYEMIRTAGPDADVRFLEYWTMKEAYVKRSGEGMARSFTDFCIRHGKDGLSGVEGEPVYFRTLVPEDVRYRISVCSEQKEDLLQVHPIAVTVSDLLEHI